MIRSLALIFVILGSISHAEEKCAATEYVFRQNGQWVCGLPEGRKSGNFCFEELTDMPPVENQIQTGDFRFRLGDGVVDILVATYHAKRTTSEGVEYRATEADFNHTNSGTVPAIIFRSSKLDGKSVLIVGANTLCY